MFSPQIDALMCIADKISREATKDGALGSLESTIPKGTSKRVFQILNQRLHIVHAPHRRYALEEKENGCNRITGRTSLNAKRVLRHAYDESLNR